MGSESNGDGNEKGFGAMVKAMAMVRARASTRARVRASASARGTMVPPARRPEQRKGGQRR